jgi:hypothetical protein
MKKYYHLDSSLCLLSAHRLHLDPVRLPKCITLSLTVISTLTATSTIQPVFVWSCLALSRGFILLNPTCSSRPTKWAYPFGPMSSSIRRLTRELLCSTLDEILPSVTSPNVSPMSAHIYFQDYINWFPFR